MTDSATNTSVLARLRAFDFPFRRKVGVVLFVALAVLPFFVETISILRLSGAFYLAVFAMTWDFQSGYTGEISFGHAFFFATGGYTAGILNLQFGIDPLLSIPVGVVFAAVGGVILGVPTLRIEGPYLSLVTLAAPLIMLQLFIYFSDITGGEVGLIGTESITSNALANYYIAFVLFAAVFLLFFAITRSDTGEIFTAIREDEDAVIAAGINPAKYKIYSFVMSGAVGGLAGGLFVHSNVGSATPSQLLELGVNINIITATVIGGMGTIIGAAAGGVFFFMFRRLLANVETTIPAIGVGVSEVDLIVFYSVAVLIMFYQPQGFIPWLVERGQRLIGADEVETDGGRSPLEQSQRKLRRKLRTLFNRGGNQ
jgi:branched-chain amino acid transport system permease protein